MEITANAVQTVTSNNDVLFTSTPVSGNCSTVHREGSGIIKLRGLSTTQCRARFRVSFTGNIALPADGARGPISLAISVDGEPLASTIMTVTPAAVSQFFNVASASYIDVPTGCCSAISVKNVSSVSIEVRNANLIVERVA